MSSYTKFKDTNVKSNRNMDCHRAYEAEECLKLSKINLFQSEIRNVCCLFFGRNYTSCPKLASSTVSVSGFGFKFQFQDSVSRFSFKIQFQDSVSSFSFKFQFKSGSYSNSCLNQSSKGLSRLQSVYS